MGRQCLAQDGNEQKSKQTRVPIEGQSYVPSTCQKIKKRHFPRPKCDRWSARTALLVSTAHWGSEQCQVTDMIDGETFRTPSNGVPVSSARTRVALLQEEEQTSWFSLLSRRRSTTSCRKRAEQKAKVKDLAGNYGVHLQVLDWNSGITG